MKFNGFDKPLIVFLILCNARLFYFFVTGFNKVDWVAIEVDAKKVARFPLTADHMLMYRGIRKWRLKIAGQELSSPLASSRSASSWDTFNTPLAPQPFCPIKC